MAVAGSVYRFSIDGISFDVAADANLNTIYSEYQNSKIATSGKAMTKKIKQVQKCEGVVLITNWSEKMVLKSLAAQLDDVKFSVTYADGSTAKTQGTFDITGDESEENRTAITIEPSEGWTVFAA
jgi:hypothetical protein